MANVYPPVPLPGEGKSGWVWSPPLGRDASFFSTPVGDVDELREQSGVMAGMVNSLLGSRGREGKKRKKRKSKKIGCGQVWSVNFI